MEAKHTPGPWFLGSNSDLIFDSNRTDANIVCRLFGKDEQDFENKEANAKLIAAAPEMLEAITYAMKIVDLWMLGGKVREEHEDEAIALEAMKSLFENTIKKATE